MKDERTKVKSERFNTLSFDLQNYLHILCLSFALSPFTLIMKTVIYLSFITASISFTLTETKLFLPVREWVKRKNSFIGELFSCGYCLGHWMAFAWVAIYQPRLFEAWWLLDYFCTAIAIAWLAAFQWILMCWLMEINRK